MNKLFKNTALYTLGNFIPSAVGFILLPIYSVYLTPSEYGIVASMTVLSSFLLIIMTLGIERAIPRLYFDYPTQKEKEQYISSLSLFILISSTIILLLVFIFSNQVQKIYCSIPFSPYYVLMILFTYFSTFSLVPKLYMRVNENAKSFVLYSLLQFVIRVLFILLFIIEFKRQSEGMLMGQLIAVGSTAVLLSIFAFRKYLIFNISLINIKKSLRFSIPILPMLFLAWITNLSDRIFIERYINLNELGIYSMASAIVAVLLLLTSSFEQAYEPYFFQKASTIKENIDKVKKHLQKINTAYIIIIMTISFLICLFSKEFVLLFLNNKYSNVAGILPLLVLGTYVSLFGSVMNKYIYQSKNTQYMLYVTIIGAAIKLLFNFILIKDFGIYGAAIGTVITYIVVFFAEILFAKKCFYINYQWGIIVPFFVSLSTIYLLFTAFKIDFINSLLIKTVICMLIIVYLIIKYQPIVATLWQKKY